MPKALLPGRRVRWERPRPRPARPLLFSHMATSANTIVLLGGGGHALVVMEAAQAEGLACAGFYDDSATCVLSRRTGLARLGGLEALRAAPQEAWILALGDLALRRRLIASLGTRGAMALAHPRSFVSPSAALGSGALVGAEACVQAYATIGAHAIINTGAIVEHECEIGENAHVAPGATLGGNVSVGADTLVGIGAAVLPGVRIGARCVIGAGATVVRNVPDGATVVGTPADATHPGRRTDMRAM